MFLIKTSLCFKIIIIIIGFPLTNVLNMCFFEYWLIYLLYFSIFNQRIKLINETLQLYFRWKIVLCILIMSMSIVYAYYVEKTEIL